jgi:glutathionylspermidine synthase
MLIGKPLLKDKKVRSIETALEQKLNNSLYSMCMKCTEKVLQMNETYNIALQCQRIWVLQLLASIPKTV